MVQDSGKRAVATGLTAGLSAAAVLAIFAKASGKGPLDEAAMQALISILQHSEHIDADTTQLIEIANRIAMALGASALNPPEITAFTVFTTALNDPVQLPERTVPYGMELVIKACHTNTGAIFVSNSNSNVINAGSSYWLIASDHIEYEIDQADRIYICSPIFRGLGVVGDGVTCTVEQKRGQ